MPPRPQSTRAHAIRIAAAPFVAAILSLMIFAATANRASAEELILGVEGNYTYNSNFFSGANNTQDAHSFQFGPTVDLADPDGRFQYQIQFNGAYQTYTNQSGVDAWQNRLFARASYDLTERTRIRITDRFRDISNLRFSRQDIAVADTALDPTQDRYIRNDVEVELIHDLTELLEFRLRGEHHLIDFDQNLDRNDSFAWEAAGELRYRAAENHFFGAGASYTIQEFDQALSRIGSTGEYIQGYATWTWIITDAITFTANGGPSFIRSDEDTVTTVQQTEFVGGQQNGQTVRAQFGSCGTPATSRQCRIAGGANPAADLGGLRTFGVDPTGSVVGKDEALTFFGGASLTADLPNWNLQIAYQRRQSTTTGDGLASALDRVSGEIEYAPPKYRSSVFIAGSWDRRETLTDSTVVDFLLDTGPPLPAGTDDARRDPDALATTSVESNSTRRDNYTVIAGYRYRLDDNLALTLDGRYRRTEISGPNANRPGSDTFFAVITFDYQLDPIAF